MKRVDVEDGYVNVYLDGVRNGVSVAQRKAKHEPNCER